MKLTDIAIVRREVETTVVPFGDKMNLLPGQEVLVTQSLGGSFTLNCNGHLLYLEGKNADAIGKEEIKLPHEKYGIKEGDEMNEEIIWEQLKTVYDPEIPVNIVDLGLIYDVSYTKFESNNYHVVIQMTLTAPGCGMGPILVQDCEKRVSLMNNVDRVDVMLIFDPPWNSDLMSEEAKLELGLF